MIFWIMLSIILIIGIGIMISIVIKYNNIAKEAEQKCKNLNTKIDDINKQKEDLYKTNSILSTEKSMLKQQIESAKIAQISDEWKETNKKEIERINLLLQEKMNELKQVEENQENVKKEVELQEKSKKELILQIESLTNEIERKQAALRSIDSFEKCRFGEELPYIDYEEYFKQNKFETVLKLLDDCIEVAPQFLSELRKIEWNLCYLPYKKTFIKEFSRSGIYMLEVKPQYEEEVLKELGLKRINDSGSIVYIGQAVNVYDRWTTHIKKMLGIESSGNEKIYKFKPLMFKWKVIEWCDSSVLNEREKFWIDSFKSDEFGLNSKGGNKKE